MIWTPGLRPIFSLELRIHAAADGSSHGWISLPWDHYRQQSIYRWMECGDCILILPRSPSADEVAYVISSTGELLRVVRSDPWECMEFCSPDGEFMEMYGIDPDGRFPDPTIFSLTHLRSGKVVSDELADNSVKADSNVFSRNSSWCSNMSTVELDATFFTCMAWTLQVSQGVACQTASSWRGRGGLMYLSPRFGSCWWRL